MLAVIDTNIWVSATLRPSGFCGPIIDQVVRRNVVPVVCDLTLTEISQVLNRPSLARRYGLKADEVSRTILLLTERAVRMPDPDIRRISRDPGDDIFIALAVAARAEYLVTRDDDLKRDLAVVSHLAEAGCEVVSVRAFIERVAR